MYWLKRHPFPVFAHFRHCLVLTYAFPHGILEPLLPPGLVVDRYHDFGFLAVALVETEALRPCFAPATCGQDFFLCGYRIFTRVAGSSSLRGLRILRSNTDRQLMLRAGNMFTHYNYRLCSVQLRHGNGDMQWTVRTRDGLADLDVTADLSRAGAGLPPSSPFGTVADARRFAGPLPFTFDYEEETHSLIRIRGARPHWAPELVAVEVAKNTFLDAEPFCRATPILASAFYVHDLPYRWERGVRMGLEVPA
jgi:hypothetical protein